MRKLILILFIIFSIFSCDLFVSTPELPVNPLDPNNEDFIPINLISLSLAETTQTIVVGGELQLAVLYEPQNTTDRALTWQSSNTAIAAVDVYGLVTGLTLGTTDITVLSTEDNSKTATLTITVSTEPIDNTTVDAASISLNVNSLALDVGQTSQLIETISPSNATNQTVSWSSDAAGIASVNSSGLVTAVSDGTAGITVITADGGFTDICTIIVSTPVTSISLDVNSLALDVSQTSQLIATINPANATNQTVSWTTDSAGIASVSSSGLVTAVSNGTAVITVITADGNFTDTCSVAVTTPTYVAGDSFTYTLSPASFNLVYVPGAIIFHTGMDDLGPPSNVPNPYWIAQTEVTFELWSEVYQWASGDTDMNGTIDGGETAGTYAFDNPGTYQATTYTPPAGPNFPAHLLNWRDAMIWCNALTEYMNMVNSTSYECVYQDTGVPVRDSTTSAYDTITPTITDGFRLLSSDEWELAARYIQDTGTINDIRDPGDYYPGNYASGSTADTLNGTETAKVANFTGSVQEVATTLNSNALGIYDMSGNMNEWVFDTYDASHKVMRGGSYNTSGDGFKLGYIYPSGWTYNTYVYYGFRIARSAD
jgi:uncharacterized protein YjdB/formylglycine-generating enzyme required for sulfatase activity